MKLLILLTILIFITSVGLVTWAIKRLLFALPNHLIVASHNRLKPQQKKAYNNIALPYIQFYYIVILGAILFNAAAVYMVLNYSKFIN